MIKFFNRILWFVGLLLLQILILNRIHWFGVATPFLYIYFVLTLEHSMSRNQLMLWAFFLGLAVDICTNTFGIHAAATTFVAFVRPSILRLFFIREENEIYEPGIRAMSPAVFFSYAFVCTLLHHAIVFLLGFFSFSRPGLMLLHIGASTLLTLLLMIAVELLRHNNR
ncbi:MAG: rod shape-determining protein MreD [Bacteroidaceae bacterium]|nr:rod shape-determining protein MreD [Bacteroidaceae bacterium]MBO4589604.1 rod shape-determining protein MreD [Bacteroidaceae bacterium]